MGSSAKTGKLFFRGSPEHFLDNNAIWDRTPPPTHQLQSTCVGEGSRVPNLQTEFNYLDSFKSYGIFSDFVVPTWSLSSLYRPHVVPIVPTSSPHCPHHPCCLHIIPIAPRRSPCGLYGLWSPWSPHVVPVIPTSSPSSPHHPRCPCHPHVIPIAPRRSPCGLHGPWSPWSHVVPIVPTSSLSSPCHPHVI